MTIGLILAKSDSKRLPNKNTLDFHGVPMFVVNLKKCLKIFDKVYVSSEDLGILKKATDAGAKHILRPRSLCGDVPNISVYKHALSEVECDAFVAVQANSPNIDPELIKRAKGLVEQGHEVMTTHKNGKTYGSIWGMSRERLDKYTNPYQPTPTFKFTDPSIDIHTQKDYELALK